MRSLHCALINQQISKQFCRKWLQVEEQKWLYIYGWLKSALLNCSRPSIETYPFCECTERTFVNRAAINICYFMTQQSASCVTNEQMPSVFTTKITRIKSSKSDTEKLLTNSARSGYKSTAFDLAKQFRRCKKFYACQRIQHIDAFTRVLRQWLTEEAIGRYVAMMQMTSDELRWYSVLTIDIAKQTR